MVMGKELVSTISSASGSESLWSLMARVAAGISGGITGGAKGFVVGQSYCSFGVIVLALAQLKQSLGVSFDIKDLKSRCINREVIDYATKGAKAGAGYPVLGEKLGKGTGVGIVSIANFASKVILGK